MDLLFKLRDAGNTVVIIELHLDVIKLADHVIELGSGGGDAGENLVYAGSPKAIAQCKESPTGKEFRKEGKILRLKLHHARSLGLTDASPRRNYDLFCKLSIDFRVKKVYFIYLNEIRV